MHCGGWLRVGVVLAVILVAVAGPGCGIDPLLADAVDPEVSAAGGPPEAFRYADGMTAAEVLEQSDQAMRLLPTLEVSTVEVLRREDSGLDPRIRRFEPAHYWAAPARSEGDADVRRYSNRTAGGRQFDDPQLQEATRASDVRFVGESHLGGRDVWVIWYRFISASTERPFEVWRTEWIDQDTLVLLRQVEDNNDPLGSGVRLISELSLPEPDEVE